MRMQFPELLQFRVPEGFSAALTAAAEREHTTAAEFLRRCVLPHVPEFSHSARSEPQQAR